MVDAVLFEFLHTEMVAELWAHKPNPDPGSGEQKMNLLVLERMVSTWAKPWVRGCPGRLWPPGKSWMSSSSCVKTCGWQCSKSRWTASAPTTRGPTSYKITASPCSPGWPRACSTWRKPPSSWPSHVASYMAPSAHWASRTWSPPPRQSCQPASSRW